MLETLSKWLDGFNHKWPYLDKRVDWLLTNTNKLHNVHIHNAMVMYILATSGKRLIKYQYFIEQSWSTKFLEFSTTKKTILFVREVIYNCSKRDKHVEKAQFSVLTDSEESFIRKLSAKPAMPLILKQFFIQVGYLKLFL